MKPAIPSEIWSLTLYPDNITGPTFTCTTRAGVDRKLDEYVKMHWRGKFFDLPVPEDRKQALLFYFNHTHDRFEIHQSSLHFTCRVCGRLLPADMVCPVCFPQKQEYQTIIEEEQ